MTPAPANETKPALTCDSTVTDSQSADSYPTDQAVYCPNCGYDLRGTSIDGPCPECGRAPNFEVVKRNLRAWIDFICTSFRGLEKGAVAVAAFILLAPALSFLNDGWVLLRSMIALLLVAGIVGAPLLLFGYASLTWEVLKHQRGFAFRSLESSDRKRLRRARYRCGALLLVLGFGTVVALDLEIDLLKMWSS